MSNRATTWARDVRGVGPGPKLVLLLLADCHNAHTGDCFPSQEKLADESGFDVRSVQRHLKALDNAGFIERNTEALGRGRGSKTHYTLHLTILQATNLRVKDLHPTPVSPPYKDKPEIEPEVTGSIGAQAPAPDPKPPSKPKRQSAPKGGTRGTRIDPNWHPTPEGYAFAAQHNFNREEINHEADQFRDYWLGVSGQKGVKLDWPATWRQNIRKLAKWRNERAARTSGHARTQSQSGGGGMLAAGMRHLSQTRGNG